MKTIIHCGAAALLGGLFLGLAEGALIYALSSDPSAGQVFPYAAALYGLAGLAFGILLGIPLYLVQRLFLRPTREGVRAFSFTLFFWAGAFYVARVRVFRDVFQEGARAVFGVPPSLADPILLALAVLLWLITWRRLVQSRPRLLAPLPAVVVFVLVAGFGYLITEDARPPAGPTLRETGRPAPPGKPNLILIAVDTLRADHVSADARLRGLSPVPVETPAMDRLAGDGTLFLNAISQSSWTKPSFATFLTGLYPSTHGAVHKLHRLPEEVETLAEILSSAGYVTGALANNVNISPTFNFQQGFTDYRYLRPDLPFRAPETGDHLVLYRALRVVNERFLGGGRNPREYYWPAEDVNREAFRWIEANAQRPFFLMIHYMDPHDPYFERPLNGRFYARIRNPNPDPSLAGLYAKAYAQEVRYLDTHIGNLLDFLKARGLYDNSLIVLLADHGEEFHEHEGWWHGTSLFEEQVRVPLILKFPKGANAGKVHRGGVELLDVPPTLLEAAGLPRGKRMQGKSLVKRAAGAETATGNPALSELNLEGHVMSSSRADRWKWIRANPGNPRRLPPESLYDITKDPGERENLAGREPALGREMDQKLRGLLDAARKGAVPQEKVTLDPATEERLRSLGYIE